MEQKMLVGEIVKRLAAPLLHGLTDETQDAPGSSFPIRPGGVEGLPDIWPVARRDKTLQVEIEVMAADSSNIVQCRRASTARWLTASQLPRRSVSIGGRVNLSNIAARELDHGRRA